MKDCRLQQPKGETFQLKHNAILTIASLFSILLFTFHISEDIVRGFEPGGFRHISGVAMVVVWLYGTLVLAGRRSGYIITLLGSLLGCLVLLVHMRGAGLVGGRIANSRGMLFWVWTLFTLGVSALFSAVLCVRGLWGLRRARATEAE